MIEFKGAPVIIVAACGLLLCAGCGGSGSSGTPAAKVKIVNELDGGLNSVGITLGGQLLPIVEDGGHSREVNVAAGTQSLIAVAYGNGQVDFPSTSVSLAPGSTYSLIAMGNTSVETSDGLPIKIVVAKDDHVDPSPGHALVRYVSCAWNAPPYSVWVNGSASLNDAYFGEVSAYSEQSAGQISIESVLGDTPPYTVYSFPQIFTLTAGKAYTFYYEDGYFHGFAMLEDS